MPGRKVWEERQEALTQFLLAGGYGVYGHAAVAGCWKGTLGRRQERQLSGSRSQQVGRLAFEQRPLTCIYGESSIPSYDLRRELTEDISMKGTM